MRAKNTTGVAVATAAAMLFGTAFVGTAVAADDTVHCTGVNSCKGQNSGKGKGFVEMSKADCAARQGRWPNPGTEDPCAGWVRRKRLVPG